jgi:hypothetical protein
MKTSVPSVDAAPLRKAQPIMLAILHRLRPLAATVDRGHYLSSPAERVTTALREPPIGLSKMKHSMILL